MGNFLPSVSIKASLPANSSLYIYNKRNLNVPLLQQTKADHKYTEKTKP